jgi:hypothetical protein
MSLSISRIREHLLSLPRMRQYAFFERITNPKAFDLLQEAGAFLLPASIVSTDGQLQHYLWPPMAYLRNVVTVIPERVATLMPLLPINNLTVSSDFASLVAKMPADVAETLVPNLVAWLDGPHVDWIWSPYLKIVETLIAKKRTESAEALVRQLLKLKKAEERRSTSIFDLPHATSVIGDGSYDYVISELSKTFGRRDPIKFARIISETLAEAFLIRAGASGKNDYSVIWNPELARKSYGGPTEALAHVLFDTLDVGIEESRFNIETATSSLEALGEWQFRRRVLLALLARHGSFNERRVALLTTENIRDASVRNEYDSLLSTSYAQLDPSEQKRLWQDVKESMSQRDRLHDLLAERSSPEEIAVAVAAAQRSDLMKRMTPVASQLAGSAAEEYAGLAAEFPQEFFEHRPGETWSGPQSPIGLEDLKLMTIADVIDYLKTWVSPHRFMAPSYAGLGRAFAQDIELRVDDYLAAVDRLENLPPIFAYHAIETLRRHVLRPGFDLTAFMRLLEYRGKWEAAGAGTAFARWDKLAGEDDSSGWWDAVASATAQALGDLIRCSQTPISAAAYIWRLLEPLASHPDPTVESDGLHSSDRPWDRSLNCVRGAAMLTIFDYVRWIHHSHAIDRERPDIVILAPEAFSVLDERLDADVERSPAVRAVYGQNFVSMFAMTRDWTRKQIDLIFGGPQPLKDAAWLTYVAMNAVYDETYPLLQELYASAIERLDRNAEDRDFESDQRLIAPHVMRIYIRGLSNIEAPSTLVSRYLEVASKEGLSSAIFSLAAPELPAVMWDRAETLFDSLLSRMELENDSRVMALEQFAYWTRSKGLRIPWAFKALGRTLELLDGSIGAPQIVLDWLATVSADYPLSSVALLQKLIGDDRIYRLSSDESVWSILREAVRARGEAFEVAKQIGTMLTNAGVKVGSVFDLTMDTIVTDGGESPSV